MPPKVQLIVEPLDDLSSTETSVSASPPMQSMRFTPGSTAIRAKITQSLAEAAIAASQPQFRPSVNNPTERRLTGRERREQVLAYHLGASLLKQYDEEQRDAHHAQEAISFGVFRDAKNEAAAAARLFIPEDQLESLRQSVHSYQVKHNRFEHEAISLDLFHDDVKTTEPMQPTSPTAGLGSSKKGGGTRSPQQQRSPTSKSPAQRASPNRSPGRRSGAGGEAAESTVSNRTAAIIRDVFNYKFDFFEKRRADLLAKEDAHREKQEEERRRAVESGRRLHRRKKSRQQSTTSMTSHQPLHPIGSAPSYFSDDDDDQSEGDEEYSEQEEIERRRQRLARSKDEKLRKFMRHVIIDRFSCPPDVVERAIARGTDNDQKQKSHQAQSSELRPAGRSAPAATATFAGDTGSEVLSHEPPAMLAAYLIRNKQLLEAVRCAADLIVFTAMRVLPPLLYHGDIASFDEFKRVLDRTSHPALSQQQQQQEQRDRLANLTTTAGIGLASSIIFNQSVASRSGLSLTESLNHELRDKGENPQKLRADKTLSVPCAMRLFELALSSQPAPTVAAVASGIAERTAREKQLRILENKRVVNHPTQAVAEQHDIWLSLTTPRILRPPLHAVNLDKLAEIKTKHSKHVSEGEASKKHLPSGTTSSGVSSTGAVVLATGVDNGKVGKAASNSLFDPEPSLLPVSEVLRTTTAEQFRDELSPYEMKLLLMLSTAHAAFVHSLCADNDHLSHKERRLVENHREDLTCVAADVIVEAALAYAESLTTNPNRTLPPCANKKDIGSGGRRQSTVDEYAEKLWEDHRTTREELEDLLSMLDSNLFLKGHDAERVALQLLQENRLVVKEVLTRMKGELRFMMTGIDDRATVLDWDRSGIQREKGHQVQKKERRLSASRRAAQQQNAHLGIGDAGKLVLAGVKSPLSGGSFGQPSGMDSKAGDRRVSSAGQVGVVVYDLPCANFREMMDEMEQSDSDSDVVEVSGGDGVLDPEQLAAAIGGSKAKVGVDWMRRMPKKPRVAHPPSVANARQVIAASPASRGSSSCFSSTQRDRANNKNTNSSTAAGAKSENPLASTPQQQHETSAVESEQSVCSLVHVESVVTPKAPNSTPSFFAKASQHTRQSNATTVFNVVPSLRLDKKSVSSTGVVLLPSGPQHGDDDDLQPPSPRNASSKGESKSSFSRKNRGFSTAGGGLAGGGTSHPSQAPQPQIPHAPIPVAKDLSLAALQRELVLLDRQRRHTNKQRGLDGYGGSTGGGNKQRPLQSSNANASSLVGTSNTVGGIGQTLDSAFAPTSAPSSAIGGERPPALAGLHGDHASDVPAMSVTASVVGKKAAETVEKLKIACKQTMQHCLATDDALLWYQQGSKRQTSTKGGAANTQQGTFDLFALSPIARLRLTVPSDIVECPSAKLQKIAGHQHRQLVHWTL